MGYSPNSLKGGYIGDYIRDFEFRQWFIRSAEMPWGSGFRGIMPKLIETLPRPQREQERNDVKVVVLALAQVAASTEGESFKRAWYG